jgi:hypothetical protein
VLYSEVVVGFVSSRDPGYGDRNVAPGRASHARQVKGDDLDEKE